MTSRPPSPLRIVLRLAGLGLALLALAQPAAASPIDAVLCGAPSGGPEAAKGLGRTRGVGVGEHFTSTAADISLPWMAKLEVVERRFQKEPAVWTCGAVAIAPRWLATAAHCVSLERPIVYRATLGARNLLDPRALKREATGAYCHPGFDKETLTHDLALLRLSEPLPADFPVLRVADENEVWSLSAGATALSAGWAKIGEGRVSPSLRRSEVRIVDPARAEDGMIEAAPPSSGPSLCVGESGAPLIADLGQGNGPALFGVFTSVDVVWDRITRRMVELCDGFEARSYFTPVRGHRLWMARVISACDQNPEGCAEPRRTTP